MIPQALRKHSDRCQGALAGLALGDAAGAPFDGWTRGTLARQVVKVRGLDSRRERDFLLLRVRRGEKARKVARCAASAHPPGLYNNSAQQALLVCEQFLLEGSLDPAGFAKACTRFVHPSKRGKFGLHRKPSPVFKASINSFAAGLPWLETGDEPETIEAALRALPAGLILHGDFKGLCRAAASLAAVTDRSAEGVTCAVAAALLTADLLGRDPPVEAFEVLGNLASSLPQAAAEVEAVLGTEPPGESERPGILPELLAALLPWIRTEGEPGDDEETLAALLRELKKFGRDVRDATSGFGPAMFAAAACLALTETSGPEKAILRAVNLGGRTSWLAALTGGFAGALFGKERFDKEWLEGLWNRQAILRIGDLVARPEERSKWPGNLYDLEKELNDRAAAFREELEGLILDAGGNPGSRI